MGTLEVKGDTVRCEKDGRWTQPWNSGRRTIDPVGQARAGMYALRGYADTDPRWQRRRLRWAHAVVLALNESEPHERSRERLYVGLSRARDQLVVCGDPAYVEAVGGRQVSTRLAAALA